jgi:iron(III) transport system ATP-binding protein
MIELAGISKSFGNYPAVSNVSLSIPDHARIALLGPSGSGKTTLLRLIAGLEIPDAGTISLDGRTISSPEYVDPPSNRSIGFVFQSAALWPHMTVSQNILFGLDPLPEKEQKQRRGILLERLKITHLKERFPDQISGGEARRVALARALAPQPSTLLFDEPLTSLDRELRDDLLSLITETVRATGSAMVYVTHDEYEAEYVADTIIRFEKGSITR